MDRKTIGGALTAISLVGTGGAVAVDNQIDPYTAKEAHYEVEIEGETIEIAKDRPEVKLNRWGGEEALVVKKSGTYEEGRRAWFSRQMEWQKGNERVIVEPIKPVEGENVARADTGGEEGFKVDILLDQKPDTNVFTLELEGWEDLDFFYQPELTPEEIAEGASRPENVVGSYAVYHKTKANHRIGGTNYQTGKLYHIYRPLVIDAEGNEVWGQLGYASGTLSVTVPQEFLDSAAYPVRVDPTFGYTAKGATSEQFRSVFRGSLFTTLEGEVTSFTAYFNISAGAATANWTLWSSSTAVIAAASYPVSLASGYDGWATSTMPSTYIAAGDYWLASEGTCGTCNLNQFYDTGAANQGMIDDDGSATNPPNPLTIDTYSTKLFSIYATYQSAPDTRTIAFTAPGYHTWTAPAGVTNAWVAALGGGGGGGVISGSAGGGGGGGAFASSTVTVAPGETYTIFVGAGGTADSATRAGTSSFSTTTVAAQGGLGTSGSAAGSAGLAASSRGTTTYSGGAGGAGNTTNDVGGGGGGAAGPNGAGVAGQGRSGTDTVGGDGGAGNNSSGGAGGSGGNAAVGAAGTQNALGGGGGGGGDDGFAGGACGAPGAGSGGGEVTGAGAGCTGQVLITYIIPAEGGGDPAPGLGTWIIIE